MDINNIFNLFNEDYINDDESSLLMDFSEHPFYKISGFNKIINNHLFFKNYSLKMFRNISNDLNTEEIERAGEYLMFDKAWGYIKDINVENPFHVECIGKKISPDFIENLDLSIRFFEKYEEYEKCALLKKIEEKAKEFSL